MQRIFHKLSLLLVLCASVNAANAQCATWVGNAMETKATDAHVSYRNFVKNKTAAEVEALPESEFKAAFENWKTAYTIAPAADGKRATHYRDGRMFYRALANKATDATKKAEYSKLLVDLYDEELACYPEGEAYLLGRKGYDMFYVSGYSLDAIDVLDQAMTKGGDKTEYIVLAPLGNLLGYYFERKEIDADRVRSIYERGVALADKNIAAGGDYATYYEAGKANLDAGIQKFKTDIFDCEYFKADLKEEFEENKDDLDALRRTLAKAKLQGCSETDAFVVSVQSRVDQLFSVKKADYEQEQRENSPGYAARKLEEAGDYSGAVAAYMDAIEQTSDDRNKALYYYQVAQIQYAELGQYGSARTNANRAANLRPDWGNPYILIGNMYGRMSRNCGDSYQQRLAVLAAIDKYSYARSIDSNVAATANKLIGRYSGSMPIKADAFSRGDKEGQRIKVGCGINETVTLRF